MCKLTQFFDFINLNFGSHVCLLLKKCVKIHRANIYTRIQIQFLKTCIKERLVPIHMYKFTRNDSNKLLHSSKERIDKLKYNFIFKYLRVELQDAYKHLGQTKSELFSICRKIEKILPNNIAYSILFLSKTGI